MGKKWTEKEIEILVENYAELTNKDLMKILHNRTYESITLKAGKLGLKKSSEIRSFLIGKRNKIVGRNLEFDVIKNIASKCKTRAEFQRVDGSAYVTARVRGWLDEVCSHMVTTSYSIPQLILYQLVKSIFKENVLYNDRKAIKPYELDVWAPSLSIAFEYNGNYWHKDEKIDKESICLKKNIKLFTIRENNRNYEEDIKTQFVDFLEQINQYLGTSLNKRDILDIKIDLKINIPDFNELQMICSKYNDFSEFSVKEKTILRKIKKMGLLKDLTSHMVRKRNSWTIDKLKYEISKCNTLSDLIKNNFKVYLICKKKYKDLLNGLSYSPGYENRFTNKLY